MLTTNHLISRGRLVRSLGWTAAAALAACAADPPPSAEPGRATETAARASVPNARCTAPSVATGATHTCTVRGDGTVACAGNNAYGQLGTAAGGTRMTPVVVAGISGAIAAAAGDAFTCVLHDDGTVRCWGANTSGQLGDGSTVKRALPTLVSGLTDARAISAGATHACALKVDGTVWCWGSNGGRLGDGTSTLRRTPVRVANLTNAVSISAGTSHSCAIVADGQAYCWGSNSYGQLGDGTRTARRTPVLVRSSTPWRSLAAGQVHTCGVHQTGDNAVECWGANGSGQLGAPTTLAYRLLPAAVVDGTATPVTDGVDVASRANTTCAILGSGGAKCWGVNNSGQIGDNSLTVRRTAVDVAAPAGLAGRFLFLARGGAHTCALNLAGELYCWGHNGSGQVGDGTRTRRSVPTAIAGAVDLTFAAFDSEDEFDPTHGAAAASAIVSDGGSALWVAGLDRHAGAGAWVVRSSTDRGATWTTQETFAYEAGRAMQRPQLARSASGTLFLVGGANDGDDRGHWIVRRSIDSGVSWTAADDFGPAEGRPATASGVAVDASGTAWVAGFADAGGARRWVLRNSSDAGATWNTVDDYLPAGATGAEAHHVLAGASGVFVIGHAATPTGARLLLRRSTDGGASWTDIDALQLADGFDTYGEAVAADGAGRLYTIARGNASSGLHWLVRRSLDGAVWSTVDDFQLDGNLASEPRALLVDRAGSVLVAGVATDGESRRHGVLRTSYDHGVTWTVSDEYAGTLGGGYAALAQDLANTLHVVGFSTDTSESRWTVRARSCLASTSPVPTLTSLSPASVPAGSPATTVTVLGTGFTAGSVVRAGGVLETSTFVSPTELRVTIAASEFTRVQDLEIVVINQTGRASAPRLFPVLLAGRTGVALTAGGVQSSSASYRFTGALTSGVGAVTNARSSSYLFRGGIIGATRGATR